MRLVLVSQISTLEKIAARACAAAVRVSAIVRDAAARVTALARDAAAAARVTAMVRDAAAVVARVDMAAKMPDVELKMWGVGRAEVSVVRGAMVAADLLKL